MERATEAITEQPSKGRGGGGTLTASQSCECFAVRQRRYQSEHLARGQPLQEALEVRGDDEQV